MVCGSGCESLFGAEGVKAFVEFAVHGVVCTISGALGDVVCGGVHVAVCYEV